MFAYTDASNDVIAHSKAAKTLAQAQAIKPEVTAVIADAPSELVVKGDQTAAKPYYHRHTSGNGTDIAHYIQIASLLPLKVARAAEFAARTTELLNAGFDSTAVPGKRFRMDVEAMQRYLVLWQTRNEAGASYPVILLTFDGEGKQNLNTAAAVGTLYTEANMAVRAVLEGESALLQQIIDATTAAEVLAVEDNR